MEKTLADCKSCKGRGKHRRRETCGTCRGSGKVNLIVDDDGRTTVEPAVCS